MDIIRIPTHYAMQITYMCESDKAYILDSIMRLSIGEIIDIEKSMRGGIVLSIWTEAVQLENKASAKKGKSLKIDIAPMVQPMVHQDFKKRATKSSQINPNQSNPIQVKTNQNSSKEEGLQAIVSVLNNELENIDNRNKGTQRIIDIIKDQVEKEGFLYDNNKEERNRATILAKRQSDWGEFIKDTPEEREEEIIRSIISYSNQNEYSAKIRSSKDFHEKWKKVANSMKTTVKKETKIHNIPSY